MGLTELQKSASLFRLSAPSLCVISTFRFLSASQAYKLQTTVDKGSIKNQQRHSRMAIASGFPKIFSGLVCRRNLEFPFVSQRCNKIRFGDYINIRLASQMIVGGRILYVPSKHSRGRHVLSLGRDNYQLTHEDELPRESFWLSLIKEAIWALKSLFVFLVEQPSQLKYIEWPSFKSTLRTAVLTLVLVALLIVALSSVDSVLCYALALLLRRTP